MRYNANCFNRNDCSDAYNFPIFVKYFYISCSLFLNRCADKCVLIAGISGAAAGAASGIIGKFIPSSNTSAKHMNNLGKQSVKRVGNAMKNKGVKPAIKTAKKTAAYYAKNTRSYYHTFRKQSGFDAGISWACSAGKGAYNRWLR